MEKNKFVSSGYSDIPHDIVFDILVRVPTKSVVRFRCVSKSFCSLISQPSFTEAHKNCFRLWDDHLLVSLPHLCPASRNTFFSSNLDIKADNKYRHLDFSLFQYLHEPCFIKLNYLGCSNGLVCLWNEDEDVAICNPFLKEHVFLPKPTEKINSIYPCVCSLGFDPTTKKYKVVKTLRASDIGTRYWVFTLGMDESWREIYCPPNFFPIMNHCICIDGVIYSLNLFDGMIHEHVAALNVGEESFRIISLPQGVSISLALFSPTIVETMGEVALLDHKNLRSESKIIMYFLNKGSCETDDQTTWIKKQTIELPSEFSNIVKTIFHYRFTSTSEGEIVLLPCFKIIPDTYMEFMYSSLFFYDTVGRKEWKHFELFGVGEANFLEARYSYCRNLVATTWSLK